YIWPYIASALQGITGFISSSGLFGTFVFGTLDKMLLPFGIHHLIAFPIEYSKVGGTMTIDGVLYEGVRNIINGQAASATATGYITRNFTNGRLLFQLAGLPAAALAMYHTAVPEKRKKVAAVLVPAVFTLALVGISEPIEYTFLFIAPLLYFLVYAP
ncbi:PTS mannose transporter subunit IIC, partial [Clostridium perfringens]